MAYKNIVRLFKNYYFMAVCMSEVWETPSCAAPRELASV